MTYRERREARAERREEWAAGRKAKSDASFKRSSDLANAIPLGQPILVGHHSEKHARRDQERIFDGMFQGLEHSKMEKKHTQAATTIQRQLDSSIYSDDTDAAERLRERLYDLEYQRDRMKIVNLWFQKNKKRFGFKSLSIDWHDGSEETSKNAAKMLTESRSACGLSSDEWKGLCDALQFNSRLGFPPYALSNLSGNISRTRKRLHEQGRDD